MRRLLAAFLAASCAASASAQSALDSAKTLAPLDSGALFDGAKARIQSPVFAGGTASAPPQVNLHLDDGRWKARDKGVWLGLGAFVAMETAWHVDYRVKHPWSMGPDSPAYLASWAGLIVFPLVGEQIGKMIDRRYAKKHHLTRE